MDGFPSVVVPRTFFRRPVVRTIDSSETGTAIRHMDRRTGTQGG